MDVSKSLFECSQTIVQLAHLADEKRIDEFVSLFEPNGQIVFSGNTYRGHSAIRDLMESRFALGQTVHICSPPCLAFGEDDSIKAKTHVVLYRIMPNETDFMVPIRLPDIIATYHDHLIQVGSDWRFSSREIQTRLSSKT